MQFQQNPVVHAQADLLTANISPNNATPINIGGTQFINTNQLGIPSLNQYEAILFYVQMANTTVHPVWASVSNPQTNSFSGGFPPMFNQGPPIGVALGPSTSLIVGCGNNIGDQISVQVWFSGVCPANSLLWVYGLAQAPAGLNIRGDGRNYPLGANQVSIDTGTIATANLIAAPGAGHRILLKSFVASISASGAGQAVQSGVTINGNTSELIVGATSGFQQLDWESGLLLDPNTAFTYTLVGAGVYIRAACAYDIVPA